jgi:hypothetical protein
MANCITYKVVVRKSTKPPRVVLVTIADDGDENKYRFTVDEAEALQSQLESAIDYVRSRSHS